MSEFQSQYTGAQIENAVGRSLPGGDIDVDMASKPNPNLLDNWYFARPVDQRGGYVVPPGTMLYIDEALATEKWESGDYYKVVFVNDTAALLPDHGLYCKRSDCVRGYTGVGYGLDRWFTVGNNSTVLINTEYIEFISQIINGFLAQKLESKSYAGKTITLSAIVKVTQNCGLHAVCYNSAGTTISDSFTALYPSSDFQLAQITIDVPNSSAVLQCGFIALAEGETSITVKAAKLELGTQQTLAHQDADGVWVQNEIPNYGEQLARCQRYRIAYGMYAQWVAVDIQTDYIDFSVYLPVTMRTIPSIEGASNLRVNGASDFTFSIAALNGNNLRVRAQKAGHGFTNAVMEATGSVTFGAEL